MVFSSFDFLFLFFPVVYFLFLVTNSFLPIAKGLLLLVASIVFYAYWDVNYLPLLLGSIVVNFTLSHVLKYKGVLFLGVCFNLALLFWFKYSVFVLGIFISPEGATDILGNIIIPLGISFFTFQQISYLVDIRRGLSKKTDFLSYAAYVALFPQLIAGPIVRYSSIDKQLYRLRKCVPSKRLLILFSSGLFLFAIGLFKKVVIADSLAHWSDAVFLASEGGEVSRKDALLGMFAYAFQLYFDFSAYSDMALGLGRMLGLYLPINFFSPYKSPSIISFWRRWHISLSFFVRDYIYIPLGGNRKGFARQMFNLAFGFTIIGIWHGAGWTFLLWGVAHALMVVSAHGYNKVGLPRIPSPVGIGITFLLVCLAWIPFRATSLGSAATVFEGIIYDPQSQDVFKQWMEWEFGAMLVALSALIVFFSPNAIQLLGSRRHALLFNLSWPNRQAKSYKFRRRVLLPVLTGASLYWSITTIGLASSAFIYFNF